MRKSIEGFHLPSSIRFQIICIFMWLGFIFAISYMESWLKFQAAGVSLIQGLSIGKLVFAALNKIEWFFAICIAIFFLLNKDFNVNKNILYIITVGTLLVQTVWLLPTLDARANAVIAGKVLPKSNLHYYYVAGEILKTVCLFLFGNKLLKYNGSKSFTSN